MFSEIFKVAAVIEDKETTLVHIRPVDPIHAGETLAQTGPAADHLPELRLGPHFLKEHQIDAFRHVDAGIHHIHRHGDMRGFIRLFKVVDHGLRIAVVANDPLGKFAAILRVEFIEPLQNKLGVTLVLSKYDRFTEPVAALHLNTPLHQIL